MVRRRIWKDRVITSSVVSDSEILFRLTGATEPDPEDSKGMTLVRSIGILNVVPQNEGGVNGVQAFFVGIGLTSEEAFGIGTTAVSSVQVEAEAPPSGWLLRTVRQVVNSVDPYDHPSVVFEWDLRAQRKLMYGVPFLRLESVLVDGGASTMLIDGVVRSLYLLP